MRPEERIAVYTYGPVAEHCLHTAQRIQEFTGRVGDVVAALQDLVNSSSRIAASEARPRGKEEVWADRQAYLDAEDAALRLAAEHSAAKSAFQGELIVIEDDFDFFPTEKAEATAMLLTKAGLSLNGINRTAGYIAFSKWMVRMGNHPRHSGWQDAVLAYYAAETGGILLSPPPEEFGQTLEVLLHDIRAEYALAWKAPPPEAKFHTVRVELRTHKSARVRTRQGYFATSARSHE